MFSMKSFFFQMPVRVRSQGAGKKSDIRQVMNRKSGRSNLDLISTRYKSYLQGRFRDGGIFQENPVPTSKKVAVVTALFGEHAMPMVQYEKIKGFDYYYVSDRTLEIAPWWNKREVRIPESFSSSERKKARWVKTSLIDLFGDYDLLLWVDANIVIVNDISPLFQLFEDSNWDLCAYPHSQWSTLKDETEAVIKQGKDSADVVADQLSRYTALGLEELPVWETAVFIAAVNKRTKKMFETWREEIEKGSIRDQISFPVAAYLTDVPLGMLSNTGDTVRSNPFFLSIPHHKNDFPARRLNLYRLQNFNTGKLVPSASIERSAFSIVVPVHGSLNHVKRLVNSLKSEGFGLIKGDECIIVDDFSDEFTSELLTEYDDQLEWIRLFRNNKNLGFTKSVNKGMYKCLNDLSIIINSDVVLPGNMLRNLSTAWSQSPKIALMGALSNNAGSQSLIEGKDSEWWKSFGHIGIRSASEMLEKSFGLGVSIPFPQIHGSFFAIRTNVFQKLGGFDEHNFPTGYGEEVDFCIRAKKAGHEFSLLIASAYLHSGAASFGISRRELLVDRAKNTLREIHGNDMDSLISRLEEARRELDGIKYLFP